MIDLNSKGIGELNKEQLEAALRMFKKAEKLVIESGEMDDNYTIALDYNLACTYHRLGIFEKSITHLRHAIQLM